MGLSVGVIGTGKLGREHVRVLKRIPEVDYVGCHEIVVSRSRDVAEKFGAEAFDDVDRLIETVDAVSVVVPTTVHLDVSLSVLDRGKHVFLEKPLAASVSEAERIIAAARSGKRVLQVGHIERFNSAVMKALPQIDAPSFIEIHRLAPFRPRGIDVSVIMDLMIHDLDLLFCMVGEAPVDVRAKGASVLTAEPDIVNARLEYASGCVANLTASRISLDPMRKVRVFCEKRYVSIDLFEGRVKMAEKGPAFDSTVAKLRTSSDPTDPEVMRNIVKVAEFGVDGEEPLYRELHSFCTTLLNGGAPVVSGEDGLNALKLATTIQEKVGPPVTS